MFTRGKMLQRVGSFNLREDVAASLMLSVGSGKPCDFGSLFQP